MSETIIVKCAYTELVTIEKCIANPLNPNKHPQEQIEHLSRLIKFQGVRHPVIISKRSGFICAGHARVEALKLLKVEQVPVDFQDFTNEAEEYAFLVSDNAIQEFYAESDLAKINLDFTQFGPEFDLDLLGIKDFKVDVADIDFTPNFGPESCESIDDLSHTLFVTMNDESAFEELFHELKNRGLKVKVK
jgi:hypothetical protein